MVALNGLRDIYPPEISDQTQSNEQRFYLVLNNYHYPLLSMPKIIKKKTNKNTQHYKPVNGADNTERNSSIRPSQMADRWKQF